MGRSNRQTADYFPHYVGEKSRTKFILEKNWGNDGYAFWFKLLELLCAADGQYYDCWDKMGWEYLLAVTGVTAETAEAILNTLASMGKVDKELWESCRVIWVQSLLENLRQLYSKRTAAPTKPSVDNFPGRRVESPAQEPAAATEAEGTPPAVPEPAPEEPATTAPEQEPETTAARAEPTESPEEPTATVEVPTTTPEPELPTDAPATPFAAAALPEPTASPLPENDLPEGMEAVKEYSYLAADGQGSDAQPTGIEYVEPEVQAQTTEEAAPAEEAPVNTTAPAASDAQQEAPASTSDAPSIGETVKRIIIEINGSGSIDVGGMNEESVLDILTRHAKPVLMSIIKGEIFEEGDLAYDF